MLRGPNKPVQKRKQPGCKAANRERQTRQATAKRWWRHWRPCHGGSALPGPPANKLSRLGNQVAVRQGQQRPNTGLCSPSGGCQRRLIRPASGFQAEFGFQAERRLHGHSRGQRGNDSFECVDCIHQSDLPALLRLRSSHIPPAHAHATSPSIMHLGRSPLALARPNLLLGVALVGHVALPGAGRGTVGQCGVGRCVQGRG